MKRAEAGGKRPGLGPRLERFAHAISRFAGSTRAFVGEQAGEGCENSGLTRCTSSCAESPFSAVSGILEVV